MAWVCRSVTLELCFCDFVALCCVFGFSFWVGALLGTWVWWFSVTRFGVVVCVWLDAWVVWFGGYCFHACLVGLWFDCLRTGVGTCYVGGFWCW